MCAVPTAPPTLLFRFAHRVGLISARYRLLIGFATGALAWLLVPGSMSTVSHWVAAWDVYAATVLLLIWAAMFTADTDHIRRVANTEDPSRALAFAFVLVAATASLLAVVALLGTMKSLAPTVLFRHILLSLVAVVESWLLVHTVFTLRYAHIFYDYNDLGGGDNGGLQFPGNGTPPDLDYLDFAYFAFIVGMTSQTADVNISGKRLRRTALLHGIISFGFNTAIVALSIGALGGLL
ncbi:MAG: DUF1345 domain-containing protein [Hymenobacter sp.]